MCPVFLRDRDNKQKRGVHSLAQVVEHGHVCIHVVEVVGVGRVFLLGPVLRERTVRVEDVLLRFGLVIHAVEAYDLNERKYVVGNQ